MEKNNNWRKTFLKINIGQLISLLTSSIIQFAIIWYITDKTGSAYYLSLATLVGFLPQGIIGIFAGSIVDKHNRKTIMIVSDLCIAIVTLGLAICAYVGYLPMWLLMLILGLRSVGSAFHGPALQASIPLIVPEDKLLKYSGYTQTAQSLSLLFSPVLAALCYSSLNMGTNMIIDVFGAIIGVVILSTCTIPQIKNLGEKVNFTKDFKEGIKVITDNKMIKSIFILSAFFMIIFMPINALFPLMTKVYFNGNAYQIALVETFFAIGMIIGSLLLSAEKYFKNKKNNIVLSIFIIGITLFLSGILPNNFFIVFLILCLFMGTAGPIFNATLVTIFAEEIKPEFLGRVNSNFMSLSVLYMPIGLILSGMFADKIGINTWFLLSGIGIIGLGILSFYNKSLKK